MKRNKGIDITRALAILLVVIYHLYVLRGGDQYIQYPIVHTLISLGGELGVTLFFIISGYGIFLSIDRQKKKNSFSVKRFFQKRCLRILPQYYISLLIIIFIGTQGAIISKRGMVDIVTHALLIHNFFPSACSSISTVLWTMGVIFQFYLISIILYKCIKRRPILALIFSVLFTIACKIVIYHFIFPQIEIEASYYFIYGRQLFTALDNFVIGMFLAYYEKKILKGKLVTIGFLVLALVPLIAWCRLALVTNPYRDTLVGYVWHSVMAIILGLIVWLISNLELKTNNVFMRVISFIAKYQYGIYLWHFVVISNMLQNSPLVIKVANRSFTVAAIGLTILCIIVGYISTITLEAPDYSELFSKKREKQL